MLQQHNILKTVNYSEVANKVDVVTSIVVYGVPLGRFYSVLSTRENTKNTEARIRKHETTKTITRKYDDKNSVIIDLKVFRVFLRFCFVFSRFEITETKRDGPNGTPSLSDIKKNLGHMQRCTLLIIRKLKYARQIFY